MDHFPPGAQGWEPGARLGTASNSLALFPNVTVAASQGQARQLAPLLGSQDQREGEGRG